MIKSSAYILIGGQRIPVQVEATPIFEESPFFLYVEEFNRRLADLRNTAIRIDGHLAQETRFSMIPFLTMMQNTPIGDVLKEFIEECGFTTQDVTALRFYTETARDREAETKAGGGDIRCFKSTGNSMYILTFANGAQHCKYVNAQMLAGVLADASV